MDIRNKCKYSFFLLIFICIIFSLSTLGGTPSFTILTDRCYVRTNTWNGCVAFGHGEGTMFHPWKCPRYELKAAVYAAFHHARYARQRTIPMSYYAVGEKSFSNETHIVYTNFEQIRPGVEYRFDIEGECVANLEVRVLPFFVSNPTSKANLYCVLVAYFSEVGELVFAVYVNINDGKASLDFHDAAINEYFFIASESRYPYLTPQECRKQSEVYIKYFSDKSNKSKQRSMEKKIKKSNNTSYIEDIKVEVPEL